MIAAGRRVGIERREDEVAVGLGRVRDPDLRAGQAVGLGRVGGADPLGARPERGGVAAGVRFGQGEGAQRLAGEHRRQPARLLLGRAPGHDRVLRQDVDRERDGHRHVAAPSSSMTSDQPR